MHLRIVVPMSFLGHVISALRTLLTTIGGTLAAAARSIGRGARSVGRDAAQVIPGEWKQRIALLFATGLALVPVIYAGNMTWSFNDPTGNLHHITAAVVDADTGADATSPDGTSRHLDVGGDLADELVDSDSDVSYRFVRTDAATARAGLADGRFGAVVEIPADFSAHIASLSGDDPLQAAPALLTIRTNDSINYVGGNFTKSIATAVRHSLEANVLEQYLDQVYLGFTTLHGRLGEAADGAHDLHDGTGRLADGTGELADGSASLADGATDLGDGAGQLSAGADRLDSGSGTLAGGAHQLSDGSYDLVIGLGQISTGASDLGDGAGTLAQGTGTLADGLGTLRGSSPTLRDGSGRLAAATAQSAQGSRTLADGSRQVADGTQKLDDTATALQTGAHDLGITPQSVDASAARLQTAVDGLAQTAHDVDAALAAAPSAPTIGEEARKLSSGIDTASADAQALEQSASARRTDAVTAHDAAGRILGDLDTIAAGVTTANDAAPGLAKDATALDGSVGDYTGTVDDLAGLCASGGSQGTPSEVCDRLQQLSGRSATLRKDAGSVSDQAGSVHDSLGSVDAAIADARTASSDLQGSASRLQGYFDGSAGQPGLSTLSGELSGLQQDARTHAAHAQAVSDAIAQARAILAAAPSGAATATQRIDELHRAATEALSALPAVTQRIDTAASDIHRLNAGAHQVADGNARLAQGTGQLADGAATLDDGVRRYTGGVDQAADGAQRLDAGAQTLAGGAARLADATGQAGIGAERLHDGASELAGGADRLHSGASELADGASRLENGAGQLADGAGRLHDGARQLDDGAAQLDDGSSRLADGLDEGVDAVPSYTDAQREHLASTASDPVGLTVEREHGVGRFGMGLVPLFLSIGLWVGGMAIFLMMSPFSASAARAGRRPLALLAGGLLPALGLGLVQTAVALGILHAGVGITAAHPVEFVLMAALTSAVFVALNHGFGAMFGPVGKFVALVLIALQVSGAGGTYPVGTLPRFFQAIHLFLPMTHAIDAFRGAIGGGWVDPAGDIAWLLGWLALALLLGLGGAVRTRRAAQA